MQYLFLILLLKHFFVQAILQVFSVGNLDVTCILYLSLFDFMI